MRVLTVSGSVRHESTNANALRALALVAPEPLRVEMVESLDTLPHFNPDLDADGATPPPPVAALRARLRAAEAVVISTPEYAHGIPGVLKNALDWLVSDGTLVGKRVLLLNATPPAQFAYASLAEILRTMNWQVIGAVELPLRGKKLSGEEIARHPDLASRLRDALAMLNPSG